MITGTNLAGGVDEGCFSPIFYPKGKSRPRRIHEIYGLGLYYHDSVVRTSFIITLYAGPREGDFRIKEAPILLIVHVL